MITVMARWIEASRGGQHAMMCVRNTDSENTGIRESIHHGPEAARRVQAWAVEHGYGYLPVTVSDDGAEFAPGV